MFLMLRITGGYFYITLFLFGLPQFDKSFCLNGSESHKDTHKKTCAFIFHIQDRSATLLRVVEFFHERKISIDTMHVHGNEGKQGMLIIHCQLEKDRVVRTMQLLGEIEGVTELEKMEGR